NEFTVQEGSPQVVQENRIDSVTIVVAHTGGDEHVCITVGIEVADADSPGPIVFNADLVGNLRKLALTDIFVEGISPDRLLISLQDMFIPSHFGLLLLFFLCYVSKVVAHIRVHVSYKQVNQTIVVEVKEFDSHASPGSLGKINIGLIGKGLAFDALKIVIVPLHVQNIEI